MRLCLIKVTMHQTKKTSFKVCSEDSTRRGVKRMDKNDALNWLNHHLKKSWEPMIAYDWILDIDSTNQFLVIRKELKSATIQHIKDGQATATIAISLPIFEFAWELR